MSIAVPAQSRRLRLPIVRWLRRGRVPIILGLALIITAICHTDWFRGLSTVQRWEGQAYDLRFRQRGTKPPHPQVVIAGITSSSLNQKLLEKDAAESEAIALMNANTWPWPRELHAKIIERLFEVGAKAVAVDIVFASDRDGDDALSAVLKRYRDRVVLASVVQNREQDGQTESVFLRPTEKLAEAIGGEGNIGYAKFTGDPVDGVVRQFDYRTSQLREFGLDDDGEELQGFAALAVSRLTGSPVPSGRHQLLNFQGPATTYRHLPVDEVFLKRTFEQGSRFEQGTIFRDKLVFYGPIAEIMHDEHLTPFGKMPGVEIHAQIAGSLLSQTLLAPVSPTLSFLLSLVCVLGAGASISFIRNALWQALAVVAIGAAFWLATEWMFSAGRMVVPAVSTLVSLGAVGALSVVFLFFLEQWERTQTRKVLDRSVNPRIAKVLMHNAESFDQLRRGERRPVVILFSDIRSFTTWSEKAEPEHLVGQLNEYFERMVELIERSETLGNAQKFIGDAILAAWGDTPQNQFGDAEDSRRAIAVALQMREALRELNTGWTGRDDRIVISIGMGINLGEVVVGEVGHPKRGEFTVLGDGVNFAARLESATKQFHTDCLVGERAEAVTRDKFVYRHVDYVCVKGKTKPVNIYIPLSDRSVPAPEWLDDYHRARGLYVERRFGEAAALFREVLARIGGEDYLCTTYAERCDLYAKEPPPADWDGSYTMTEK
jgi:adenylate cyclase